MPVTSAGNLSPRARHVLAIHLCLMAAIACPSLCEAQLPDDVAMSFVAKSRIDRDRRAEQIRLVMEHESERLKVVERGRINPRLNTIAIRSVGQGRQVYEFPSPAAKTAAIAEVKAKVDAAQLSLDTLPPVIYEPAAISSNGQLQLHAIGAMETTHIHVSQVIDDHNVLCDVTVPIRVSNTASLRKQRVWITGVDTSGMTDGAIVNGPLVYYVTRTKQYRTTIGGTKTVFVLEPVDFESLVERFGQRPQPQPIVRRWSDSSGRFAITATLKATTATDVVLVTDEGKEITVSIDRLSDADQQFVSANKVKAD